MSIYTIANLAGSAGKSTTAVALGVLAAHRGASVRIVDCDPQANASKSLGHATPEDPTIADILNLSASVSDAEVSARVPVGYDDEDGTPIYDDSSVIENLTVVPARRSTLDQFLPQLPSVTGGITRLRRALAEADPVDITIIDAPGASNALTLSALVAVSALPDPDDASGVITCTLAGPKEIEGITDLQNEMWAINDDRNLDLKMRGIVVCNVLKNSARLYQESIEDLNEAYGPLVAPPVRNSVGVPEAYSLYLPTPLYGRARRATEDYADVLDHFIKQGLFPEAR